MGDAHIGKGLSIGKSGIGFTLNSRLVDQINLLDFTLDKCIENSVKDLFLTGDIFEDPKPSSQIINLFISWVKKVSINNINLHIIIGNHETQRSGNYYTSPLDIISELEFENVFVYKSISTIHLEGYSITLLPFRDKRSFNVESNEAAIEKLSQILKYEVASIPVHYKKIIIGHMAIEGSIPIGDEISDMSNELYLTKDILKDYDYCWQGHIHRQMVMSKSPYIAHVGSMDLSDFGEDGQEKILIHFSEDLKNNFEHIKLPVRPLKKISITVPKDTLSTDYVIAEINKLDNLAKAIVKLEVILSVPELLPIDRTKVEKALTSKNIFFLSKIIETKKAAAIKQKVESLDTMIDEEAAIKLFANTFIEKDLRSDFISLAISISKEVQS